MMLLLKWRLSPRMPGTQLGTAQSQLFHTMFRFLLTSSGLGWLAPSHKNVHGSNSLASQNITNLFSNSSSSTIEKIISRYEKDFRLCGYEDTMQELQVLAKQKAEGVT